eukprot:gene10802-22548_t
MSKPMESNDGLPPRPSTSQDKRLLSSQIFSRFNEKIGDEQDRPKTSIRSIRSFDKNSSSPTYQQGISAALNALILETNNCSLLRILNEKDSRDGNSILTYAERGDENGVRRMLNSTGDINQCKGMDGFTALHHASRRGHAGVISILLKAGMHINCKNSSEETPLHLAAYAGHLLIVEQLLDNDANIDEVNQYGETALFYASRRSIPAVVRLLIQRGANANIKDQLDETAEDQAGDARTTAVFRSIHTVEPPGTLSFVCILHIFRFLDARGVGLAACVSGKWHRVSESKDIWIRLGIRRWERSLQCSLGFGATPASSFRPKASSSAHRPPAAIGWSNNKTKTKPASR